MQYIISNNSSKMKKILFTLICIPLLFNSCKKDKSSAPSTICGSATVTVDGVNYTLTNPMTDANGDCIILTSVTKSSGMLSGIAIYIQEMGDWLVNANLVVPFTEIGTPININQSYSANNSISSTTYIGNMMFNGELLNANNGLYNGEITITNIDYANETIDGEFSFTGYSVNSPMPGGSTSQQVSCTFSDIPFGLTEI